MEKFHNTSLSNAEVLSDGIYLRNPGAIIEMALPD
ncbi:uncharacterized protein METZ01_LOCUS308329 [marine metagenome]|uniref:Uncharacterized protein n=1 Tax=marine metagenome TaxID=408172 RepID=A0A382N575_9ZZZZ